MKILCTGSSGFIGSHLTKKLNELNIDWVGYDLQDGDDIRDKLKLDKLFEIEGIDTIIHLAALAGVRRGDEYPNDYWTTNVIGTKNLVELSQKYKIKKFISFSSSSVYGDQLSPLNEDMLVSPKSIYGFTKAIGEKLVKESNLNYIIIRPFTVYGENGRGDQVIYKWLNQIKAGKPITFFGDGLSKRGYTYVGDLVDGVIKCLESGEGTLNLGGSQIITLRMLLDIFIEEYPDLQIEQLPFQKSDVFESYADTTKAKELGWEPKQDFKTKVKQIIQ